MIQARIDVTEAAIRRDQAAGALRATPRPRSDRPRTHPHERIPTPRDPRTPRWHSRGVPTHRRTTLDPHPLRRRNCSTRIDIQMMDGPLRRTRTAAQRSHRTICARCLRCRAGPRRTDDAQRAGDGRSRRRARSVSAVWWPESPGPPRGPPTRVVAASVSVDSRADAAWCGTVDPILRPAERASAERASAAESHGGRPFVGM